MHPVLQTACCVLAFAISLHALAEPVTLTQDDSTYTLANGIVTARVAKSSGQLTSLRYKDSEMFEGARGGQDGYWSHSPTNGTNSVTIDPAKNGGARAEVSIKALCGGKPLGSGPGGSFVADIEIRYALGRGDSGVYTYSIFTHTAAHPATSLGEARFAMKLNDRIFDFMTIDADRQKVMITAEDWRLGEPLNMKEAKRMTTGVYAGQPEHKYDYSAVQFDTPSFGWSSTQKHIGLWIVNPTIEYLSGGATKVELTGHRDVSDSAAPVLLNYWRGSHYGGSSCVLAPGETWSKVVGPFLIYCNTADTHEAIWKDALALAAREGAAWPYDWVTGCDYPHKSERGSVSGRLELKDREVPQAAMKNVLVGLAAPAYTVPDRAGSTTVDWQLDAKHYEFWVRANERGEFSIPNVRAGLYTLHAIADGVLGELTLEKINVESGKHLELGKLEWKPLRYGKQLWEIGTPDRSAREFRHGDHYWQWGLYNEYAKEFPNEVNFIVGKSDWKMDWNYAQLPRDRAGSNWSVTFDMAEVPAGKATLRIAIAGNSARRISVTMNGQLAGDTGPLPDTAVIRRDGIRGLWFEKDVTFDAALMKTGTNVLTLTIPAGGVMSGVEYDYLRLELGGPP